KDALIIYELKHCSPKSPGLPVETRAVFYNTLSSLCFWIYHGSGNKYSFDKTLPENGITEPDLVFHGQEGKGVDEDSCKYTGAAAGHLSGRRVNFDTLHSGTGRFALGNKPANPGTFQVSDFFLRPSDHALRMIGPGKVCNKPRRIWYTHEAHGLPGYRQAAFYLGTNWYPLDEASEGV